MIVTLSTEHLRRLRKDATQSYPDECCGLLVGCGPAGGPWQVDNVIATANVAPDPARHFEVDPTVHLYWQRRLRGTDSRVIGHYHSHPNGRAEPSGQDRAEVTDRGLVWLILSTTGSGTPEIRAWVPADHGFGAVEVVCSS